jgi:glucosamine--fructose-6-phosphate aminotransferase (isomerizing)
MCGIIGFIGNEPAAPIVLEGLLKLEYRGYDSAGLASIGDGKLHLKKDVGKIGEIDKRHKLAKLPGNIAIAHTRWATHGGVCRENAHPHVGGSHQIAVVHNGIVENYRELRRMLTDKGHTFISDTDTEVIPHLIEDCLEADSTLESAVLAASQKLEGSYAFIAISAKEPEKMVAIRKDNPLVISSGDSGSFATSDILSLPDCDKVIFPEDGELVTLSTKGVAFLNTEGKPIEKKPSSLKLEKQASDKGSYRYFMLKEIMEEPQAVRAAIMQDKQPFTKLARDILKAKNVVITACGTSRYAALVGRYLFSEVAKKFCDVVMASEFQYFSSSIDRNTLVIAVSQSGETADVTEGVKRARANEAQVISIINKPGSILSRMSDGVIYLNCGPEIAVAATKTMISQLTVFYLLAFTMANRFDEAVDSLKSISQQLTKALDWNRKELEKLAKRLKDKRDFYYIARGINFPIASEAALKLKEISYVHAEGLPAGELKHGTLALVEEGTPVIVICPNDYTFNETLSNAMEAKSRGAFIIGVSDRQDELYDAWIKIPQVDDPFYPLISIAPLHLFAYYLALELGKDPDKPRNLAKSVTVK